MSQYCPSQPMALNNPSCGNPSMAFESNALHESYPSYQYPNQGPWGLTVNDQLRTNDQLNASFSQQAWENAKLNGCQPPPCLSMLPNWPPPSHSFVYPVLDKQPNQILNLGADCFVPDSRPYVSRPVPALPSPVTNVSVPSYCGGGPTLEKVGPHNMPEHLKQEIERQNYRGQIYQGSRDFQGSQGYPGDLSVAGNGQYAIQVNASSDDNPYNSPTCSNMLKEFHLKDLPHCMADAVRGVFYDLSHWKNLETPEGQTSFLAKLRQLVIANDRWLYLGTMLVSVVFIIMLVSKLLK